MAAANSVRRRDRVRGLFDPRLGTAGFEQRRLRGGGGGGGVATDWEIEVGITISSASRVCVHTVNKYFMFFFLTVTDGIMTICSWKP